jgi:DNA-binding transcriptional LysR family regulator
MTLRPSYRALSIFLTAVDQGTFSAAANFLGVSQPTVSQQISGLERELGCHLFHRGGRVLSLTPEGETLLAGISRQYQEIDLSWSELLDKSSGKGNVTVASVHTLFSYFLSEVLTSFIEDNPGAHPDLRGRSSAEVVRMVQSRSVELGLVYDTSYVTDDLESKHLFVEGIVAVIHPDAPWAKELEETGELSADMPVISFQTGYALRSLLDRMAFQVPLNIVSEIDNTELILTMASAARGVALLPRGFAQRRAAAHGLVWKELRYPKMTRTVIAIWRRGEELRPLTRAFLETCFDVANAK